MNNEKTKGKRTLTNRGLNCTSIHENQKKKKAQ